MKFYIFEHEVIDTQYEIEAENKQEAESLFNNGHGNKLDEKLIEYDYEINS